MMVQEAATNRAECGDEAAFAQNHISKTWSWFLAPRCSSYGTEVSSLCCPFVLNGSEESTVRQQHAVDL